MTDYNNYVNEYRNSKASNRADRCDKLNPSATKTKSLVHIEPFRLWTIKVLNRFNIISKDELAALLEQYLDSVNKAKANINQDTERESDEYLVTLEPTNWKEQDHYLVLGLQHLRWRATEEDVRRAHRRKALKHHPDKRGKKTDLESDYYSCITRAIEILGDPIKRRSFDSVDPTFNDSVPPRLKAKILETHPLAFFSTFRPVFQANARWSIKPNVPYLGDNSLNQEYVEKFYEFWYNFQSWREFSYLDEEDKEKGENRDERRWLDKQNKAARLQRKKQENQRLRQLVDNAYACDPRVAKFKEQAKKRKEEEKKAKLEKLRIRIDEQIAQEDAVKQKQLEEESKHECERKRKKLEEKRQRENVKKQAKKTVKSVEEIFKAHNYFVVNQNELVKHIEDLDKLMQTMSLECVVEFKEELENSKDKRRVFLDRIEKVNEKIEEETRKTILITKTKTKDNDKVNIDLMDWTASDLALLGKAVAIHPQGLKNRWEVIAQYLCLHSSKQRDAKQVIAKVRQMQAFMCKEAKESLKEM